MFRYIFFFETNFQYIPVQASKHEARMFASQISSGINTRTNNQSEVISRKTSHIVFANRKNGCKYFMFVFLAARTFKTYVLLKFNVACFEKRNIA